MAEDDALVEAIDEAVVEVNYDREWVNKVLAVNTIYEDVRVEAMLKGEAKGRAEGEAHGEAKLSALMERLFASGRIDDAKRVTTDTAYRTALFEEFGIA